MKQFGEPEYEFLCNGDIDANGKTIFISNDLAGKSHVTLLDENGMVVWNYDHQMDSTQYWSMTSVIRVAGEYVAWGTEQGRNFLVALDTNGTLLWEIQLDSSFELRSVTRDDSRIYLLGAFNTTSCISKLDLAGNILWSKTYWCNSGISPGEICYSPYTKQLAFTGSSSSWTSDVCITDTNGNPISKTNIGIIWTFRILPDGMEGYVIGGETPPCGTPQTRIMKVDQNGVPVFETIFDWGILDGGPIGMCVNDIGEIYFGTAGQSMWPNTHPMQVGYAKLSGTGNLLWCKTLHADSSFNIGIRAMRELGDGSLAMAGLLKQNGMNLFVARQDTSAALDCLTAIDSATYTVFQPGLYPDTIFSAPAQLLTTAFSYSLSPSQVAQGFYCTTGIEEQKSEQSAVFPNPAVTDVYIESENKGQFILWNTVGQVISIIPVSKGQNRIVIPEAIANGIYIYTIESEGRVHSGKLVVDR